MKATEWYFHVVLFIMLYDAVVTIQMKGIDQYFHLILFNCYAVQGDQVCG